LVKFPKVVGMFLEGYPFSPVINPKSSCFKL
jgi:hypothetical protein